MDDPKRITQLTEVQSISPDDYIAMDSANGGTKKIKAKKSSGEAFRAISPIRQTLQTH